jgi:hypothetical protein
LQQDNRTLELFIEPLVVRYRGSLPRKSRKEKKNFNIKLLNSAINGEWQNAYQLSLKTGICYCVAFHLLRTVAWENYDIEISEETWIDEKFRNRKRSLYRRKTANISLMDTIFGVKMPSFKEATVTKHYCMDD